MHINDHAFINSFSFFLLKPIIYSANLFLHLMFVWEENYNSIHMHKTFNLHHRCFVKLQLGRQCKCTRTKYTRERRNVNRFVIRAFRTRAVLFFFRLSILSVNIVLTQLLRTACISRSRGNNPRSEALARKLSFNENGEKKNRREWETEEEREREMRRRVLQCGDSLQAAEVAQRGSRVVCKLHSLGGTSSSTRLCFALRELVSQRRKKKRIPRLSVCTTCTRTRRAGEKGRRERKENRIKTTPRGET